MKKETLTIEQALKRMEEIVRKLEDSGTTLDDSIQLYEEGLQLSRQCLGQIGAAQQIVEQRQPLE